MCGASPIQASSGKTVRHRLNRGGNRRAGAALYRIVLVRLRYHQPTKDYVVRRLAEGKSKQEIIRCLTRYLARKSLQRSRKMREANSIGAMTLSERRAWPHAHGVHARRSQSSRPCAPRRSKT